MAKQQRMMRVEQRSQLAAMQQLESRSDEELEAETRFKAAAQAILGARAAERYDAKAARAHFQRALAASRPQERLQLRRMADASLALAERRADDLKKATERLGVEAPSNRQLFGLKLMGLLAPPANAGTVAPGDPVVALTTDREGRPRGELLRWGLVPSWAKGPDTGLKMINARVETVAERPAYRRAFERFRCLLIADGFYEWQRTTVGPKQAFHIALHDGQPFAFAGLWSIWHGEADVKLRTCTILTTAANEAIAPLHDRMPIILGPEAEAAWLDPSIPHALLSEILAGLPSERTALRPVGSAVNDAR